MATFYEMLERIRKIPGGFLGKPYITRLYYFLEGIDMGLRMAGAEQTADEKDFAEFRE